QDDRLVDDGRLCPVVIRIGRRDAAPGTDAARLCRGLAGAGPARAGGAAQVELAELVGGLPDVRVTIDNHQGPLARGSAAVRPPPCSRNRPTRRNQQTRVRVARRSSATISTFLPEAAG